MLLLSKSTTDCILPAKYSTVESDRMTSSAVHTGWQSEGLAIARRLNIPMEVFIIVPTSSQRQRCVGFVVSWIAEIEILVKMRTIRIPVPLYKKAFLATEVRMLVKRDQVLLDESKCTSVAFRRHPNVAGIFEVYLHVV